MTGNETAWVHVHHEGSTHVGSNAILIGFRATRFSFLMITCSMMTAQHGVAPSYKDPHLIGTMAVVTAYHSADTHITHNVEKNCQALHVGISVQHTLRSACAAGGDGQQSQRCQKCARINSNRLYSML